MEATQGYIVAATPPSLPLKRKRGRPRKDRSLEHSEYACISRKVQSWKNMEKGHSQLNSPGFILHPHEETLGTDGTDSMVGLPVAGVIDATFDAGYLLTVRIGDTSRVLKGIVFKPGLYTPVSPQNDVAPNVRMIKRKNISLPSENTSNTPRYGTVFPSDISHSTTKGKEVSPPTHQPPVPVKTDGGPASPSHQFTDKQTLTDVQSHQINVDESKSLEQPVFSSNSPKKQAEVGGIDAGGVKSTVEFLSNTAEATWAVKVREPMSMNECRGDDKNGRIMELLQAMQENRNDE